MTKAMWFRNDLRVYDNPALHAACNNNDTVIAFYFFTPHQHQQHGIGDTKLRFMLENLCALKDELTTLNIPLIALLESDYKKSVSALKKMCIRYAVTEVFANQEVELNEIKRDKIAKDALIQTGIQLQLTNDQFLIHPSQVTTEKGLPYRVFTPFKRAWMKQAQKQDMRPLPAPKKQKENTYTSTSSEEILSWQMPTSANHFWPAGSTPAYARLTRFAEDKITHYKDERDLPNVDATSQISPYLAAGAISLRSCLVTALYANSFEWDSGNQGVLTWINELIWREFYKHLTFHYPSLCKGHAFQKRTECIPWCRDNALLEQWQQGNTGYPMVDAGMRQLNELGWMHNRLRMVTAMFLTKHLFISWRLGERYFMEKLIDADFSANNGGWQWSASTGADAAPYFRVFNPQRQSERFDKNGSFIKQWVPELAELHAPAIHNPSPIERQIHAYPNPLVDHKTAVERVKQEFKIAQAQVAAINMV
jgi:deoxyribodipyrimidine photo-lyase